MGITVIVRTAPEKTPRSTIRRANSEDRENVIAALTMGFSDDVIISGWVFTDPDTYERYASGYFACYTDFAIAHGYVWTTGDTAGALITLPAQAWQLAQQDTGLKERMIRATGPYATRVFALEQALANRHPGVPDYLYAAFIAVAPRYRSQSIGPQMIREFFRLADRMQLPIYGEATTDRNSRLYDRLGIRRHGNAISLPRCDAELFPFWRPAN